MKTKLIAVLFVLAASTSLGGLLDEAHGAGSVDLVARQIRSARFALLHDWSRNTPEGKIDPRVIRVDDPKWIDAVAGIFATARPTKEETSPFGLTPPLEFWDADKKLIVIHSWGELQSVQFGGASGVYRISPEAAAALGKLYHEKTDQP